MRRSGGLIALYALVATLALAAPIAISEEPVEPVAPTTTTAAPEPAAAAPAAPAPAAPAPAEPAPAPAAPTTTTASAQPVLKDDAPVEKPKKKVIAIAAASAGVTISDFQFAPGNVTVNVGETVTWSNNGPTGHSATATNGSFDTGVLQKGSSGSHTFSQAGTFSYFCKPHPFMKGTIVVQAAQTGGGTSGGTSGGSTGSGATGSTGSAGTGATASQAEAGPTLPNTGGDSAPLLVLGGLLLALGVAVHRRTAAE